MSPRSKQFDPEEALERALEVFWRDGYDATSVAGLVTAMGINRFSLYDTFGDKENLFLLALERYGQRLCESLKVLESRPTGIEGVTAYFQEAGRRLRSDPGGGCLLTNCAVEVAGSHQRAKVILLSFLERIEEAFHTALVRSRSDGELRSGLAPRDGARFLVVSLQGLAVLARVGPVDRVSPAIVRVIVQALR